MPRVDDRRVISGIVHVLRSGRRWDAPLCYGPPKTLCNRFVRWAAKGVWEDVFIRLAEAGGPPATLMIDVEPVVRHRSENRWRGHVKAHRSAAGRKKGAKAQGIGRSRGGRTTKIHAAVDEHGRPRRLIIRAGHHGDAPVAAELIEGFAPALRLADAAHDSDALGAALVAKGARPVIPNNLTRKRPYPFDRTAYRLRNAIERTFRQLEDRRRIATGYDRLARNFLAAITVAAIVSYWI